MPRKSICETAMTDAERQVRYRAARATGVPVVRVHRPADHRGRARRWTDHVAGLVQAQAEYAAWLENPPDSLQDGTTAEANDLRSRPERAPGNHPAARLRPGLTIPLSGLPRHAQGPPTHSAPRNATGRCATGVGPSYA